MNIIKKSNENLTNKDLYFLLTDKSVKKLSDCAGKTISIIDWVLYEDVRRDTGEVQKVLSIKTSDGTFATNSPSCIESFEKIAECFDKDFSKISIVKNKSRMGREYLDCSYVE